MVATISRGDELRRGCARHQHGADQEVRALDHLGDRRAGEKMVRTPVLKWKFEAAQRFRIAVHHGDVGAHAERDGGRMRARARRRRG